MIAIMSAYQQHLIIVKNNNIAVKKIHFYRVQWISIKPKIKRVLYKKAENLY